MATLAEAVDAAETDWLVSADIPDSVDYLTVESEVVQVTATFPAQYQARDGSTSDPRIRVVRAAGGTSAASHADATALTPLIPPAAGGGGAAEPGTVVVTPPNEVDIGAALDASISEGHAPSGSNGFVTTADIVLANLLANDNDAGGDTIANLADPDDPQQAATKHYVDGRGFIVSATDPGAIGPGRIWVNLILDEPSTWQRRNALDDGWDPPFLLMDNITGGLDIVSAPAVDLDALTSLTATATGTGDANTRPLAQVEDGNAVAGPRAEATGIGNTDACAYARAVDGDALADNDAAATGTGLANAGGYAVSVDGNAFSGGMATATGSGNADASDLATANTGFAQAGSLAVRGAAKAGMESIVDGTSARMAFNGTTPIAKPAVTGSRGGNAALASLLTELANLGLITDSSSA